MYIKISNFCKSLPTIMCYLFIIIYVIMIAFKKMTHNNVCDSKDLKSVITERLKKTIIFVMYDVQKNLVQESQENYFVSLILIMRKS